MNKAEYKKFVRTNGRVDRKNKFTFELLKDKQFRSELRLMWSSELEDRRVSSMNTRFYFYNSRFLSLNWGDDNLLKNINKLFSLYEWGGVNSLGLWMNIPGYENFRMSPSKNVDKKGKPVKYTTIAYTREGHEECIMSASKMFIEAYKQQSYNKNLHIPNKVLNRCSELFAIEWEAYVKSQDYTLHIDDNFEGIYDAKDFGSCMTDKGFWTMYRDAAKCRAAYLTKGDDIVARAILWEEAMGEDGNSYRLLDRCYSLKGDLSLQQVLIDQCREAGVMDLYKPAGCSCQDNRRIKKLNGADFYYLLSIELDLEEGDIVSYMDTFAFYNIKEKRAYNYDDCAYTHQLDTTGGCLSGSIYSDYYDNYINEDVAAWSEDVSSYIDCNDKDFVYVGDNYCLKSNCICTVDTENYFKDADELYYAEDRGEYYENNTDLVYSDESECYYHIDSCVYSRKRDVYIYEEEAIFIKDEDDYDFASNADEYDYYGCAYHTKEKVVND